MTTLLGRDWRNNANTTTIFGEKTKVISNKEKEKQNIIIY